MASIVSLLGPPFIPRLRGYPYPRANIYPLRFRRDLLPACPESVSEPDTEERRSAAAYRARGAPCWSWWMFSRAPVHVKRVYAGCVEPLTPSYCANPGSPGIFSGTDSGVERARSRFLGNSLLFFLPTLLIVSSCSRHFIHSFYDWPFLNSLWDAYYLQNMILSCLFIRVRLIFFTYQRLSILLKCIPVLSFYWGRHLEEKYRKKLLITIQILYICLRIQCIKYIYRSTSFFVCFQESQREASLNFRTQRLLYIFVPTFYLDDIVKRDPIEPVFLVIGRS